MAFNWKEFLDFAENLYAEPNKPGPPEAAFRSAASRAYYAAFHAAFDLGKSRGFTPAFNGDDHKGLINYFLNLQPKNPQATKLSTKLDRLRDYRRRADYDNLLGTPAPQSIAYYAIGMAKEIFICVNELSDPK
jgi:uncharacterized protein (UPF0332 family)